MRTDIVIDDKLIADALRATGLSSKSEVVELGLKLLLQRSQQQGIRQLREKLKQPNEVTIQAIKELEDSKGHKANSTSELFNDLDVS